MSLVLGVVFERNARFQASLDRGYDRDNIIIMPLPPENFTSFRNEMLRNPGVIAAEGTMHHIEWGASRRPVKDGEKQLEVDFMDVGPNYLSTMGVRLTEGRLFDEAHAGGDRSNHSVVVNRQFVEGFGWKDPVGKTFTMYDTVRYNVIGVVQDFYTNGLWDKIMPAAIRLTSMDIYNRLVVRGKTADLPAILDFMKNKWKEQGTNFIFGGRLQEDLMQEEKDINGSILKVNIFLAIAATLLSLIGMYNMVSLDIIKRTKEIGLRKIQGAPFATLVYLMSRKFIIILAISSILGVAGGVFLSGKMLSSIWNYFVDITPSMLLFSVGLLAVATLLTIFFKITSAAMRNPVDALRYE
jgi:ABC-type antimicrobial peptide transport system permease subunit